MGLIRATVSALAQHKNLTYKLRQRSPPNPALALFTTQVGCFPLQQGSLSESYKRNLIKIISPDSKL